jgi:predicted AAA+ superfamily ATPase
VFLRRQLLGALASRVSRDKVRLLFGARQTGKTMLLRHAVPDRETWRVDLTSATDRRRYEADPGAFRREVEALPAVTRHVVVDEIQKVPALLDEVQALYDARRSRVQFYLTGSSARRLRRGSANLLPGRSHTFRLFPVCRWECAGPRRHPWAGAEPPAASRAADAPPFPEQGIERTLLYGNLPGVRAEPEDTAAATLSAYVENYLEEEIRREAVVRDLGAFGVFVRLAAIESGAQVNVAGLSRESGVPASTLRTYYEALVDTFAGHWLRRGVDGFFAGP